MVESGAEGDDGKRADVAVVDSGDLDVVSEFVGTGSGAATAFVATARRRAAGRVVLEGSGRVVVVVVVVVVLVVVVEGASALIRKGGSSLRSGTPAMATPKPAPTTSSSNSAQR